MFGLFKLGNLLPLIGVLLIVVYAYVFPAMVASRTELHARAQRAQDVGSIAHRLSTVAGTSKAVLKDEGYQRDEDMNVAAVTGNMNHILARTFGFQRLALFDSAGNVVLARGLNNKALADLRDYSLLKRCRQYGVVTGAFRLGKGIYIGSASIVRGTAKSQLSSSLEFVGRRINEQLLREIGLGANHHLVMCDYNGRMMETSYSARARNISSAISSIAMDAVSSTNLTIQNSRDQLSSYATMPILDIRGRPAAVLVDVVSRADQVSNLRATRQISLFLVLACVIAGMIWVRYSRSQSLALRAHRDDLTGLHNHRYLQEYLRNFLQLGERYNRPLSLLMVDIDHFKVINDSHGHAAGDYVLKCVADTIVETVREADVVARYGGEEFIIVLPETLPNSAFTCAERLREAVEKRTIHIKAKGELSVAADVNLTVSVGIASFPRDGANSDDLIAAADAALGGAKRTRNQVMRYRDVLKDATTNSDRAAALDGFLRDSSLSSVRPLVAAIDIRDRGSAHHSEKTAEYAVAIGRELHFSTQDLAVTCKAGLLHDVGKIGIPDRVLTKVGALSPEEKEIVRNHSKLGADILQESPLLSAVADIVLRHHERYDGTGYPDGLVGDDIPLIARVLAVADSLDAMTSPRPYRQTLTLNQALHELKAQSGKQFDPVVVEAAERAIVRLSETKNTDGSVDAAA